MKKELRLLTAFLGLSLSCAQSLPILAKGLPVTADFNPPPAKKAKIETPEEEITAQWVANFLKNHDNYAIITHSRADGDTLGSAYALVRALQKMGKKAKVVTSEPINPRFEFLLDGVEPQEFVTETVIAVDIQSKNYVGGDAKSIVSMTALCIDHHPQFPKPWAPIALINTKAAAAAEIVYDVINCLGPEIMDKSIAEKLYTAITTDTGCFKYDNVTPETHNIAGQLLAFGINSAKINREMFDVTPEQRLRLEGHALASLTTHFDGKCAIIRITQDMLEKVGLSSKVSGGFAHLPIRCKGAYVGVTLIENDNGTIYVSIRTVDRKVDANEICKTLINGGGHVAAAGGTIEDSLENAEKQILEKVKVELDKLN